MNEITVKIQRNALIERLHKLEQDMTDRNDHDEAFLIDLAIQTIKSDAPSIYFGAGGAGSSRGTGGGGASG